MEIHHPPSETIFSAAHTKTNKANFLQTKTKQIRLIDVNQDRMIK